MITKKGRYVVVKNVCFCISCLQFSINLHCSNEFSLHRRANSGNNKTRMDSVESAKIVVIHGRKRIVVKEVFNEFCDSSTIHGLKYLGTRPTHEKYVNIGAPSIFRHYTIIVYLSQNMVDSGIQCIHMFVWLSNPNCLE